MEKLEWNDEDEVYSSELVKRPASLDFYDSSLESADPARAIGVPISHRIQDTAYRNNMAR
jgi:hypothetical protein